METLLLVVAGGMETLLVAAGGTRRGSSCEDKVSPFSADVARWLSG